MSEKHKETQLAAGRASQGRLQQRGARTQGRNKHGEIKSCHAGYITEYQAAGEREEGGGAEEAVAFTEGPRSLSLAAARGASARRPPARTRWPPGFRSLDPGHSMTGGQIIG